MAAERALLADTDVLVDFLRGEQQAVDWPRTHAKRMSLPTVVVAELYAGARADEIPELDRLFPRFPAFR